MDERRADELTALRAEVAALRAKVERPRRRRLRRLAPLAAGVLLTALAPLSILAADPVFTDLGSAAPVHQNDIQAIGNAGITTGFEDPDNPNQRLYYPKQNVTREEMASFLARTAGIGGNKPIANAARLAPSDPAAGGPTFAANELTRLGFVNDNTAATPVAVAATGQTTVATVPLTTTTQAYVRVSFSALLLNSSATTGGASDCPCSVRAYIQQDSGTPQPVKRINVGTALVGGYDRSDLTGAFVFLAPPGGHSYKLIVEQVDSSSGNLTISYPNIQAEIFPFGSNGSGAAATGLPTEQIVPQD